MSDIDHDKEFDEAFAAGLQIEEPPVSDPPKDDPVQEDGGKDDTEPKDPKPEDQAPADPQKVDENGATPPAGDPSKAEAPADPSQVSEEPKPLTRDDVTSIISNIRTEERMSAKELENTTNDIIEAYYPEGLSNTLRTPDGKELRTPQDVVDAAGGNMSLEEAQQWLMNKQYQVDQEVSKIKDDIRKVAEQTINFKRDSVAALQKYEPLFKAYPHLQEKSFKLLMKQVKADTDKGVILSAPDVMDLYDTYLEPYQLAFEHANQQPATNPTPPPEQPPQPSVDDRLDEGADGGATGDIDDPNDFAQQVKKELAKGI